MKSQLKELIRRSIKYISHRTQGVFPLIVADSSWIKIEGSERTLKIFFSSPLEFSRWSRLKTKEKETIEWISEFKDTCIFIDIGANIGNYTFETIANKKNAIAIAVEPSILSCSAIQRNLYLNKLESNIILIHGSAASTKSAQLGNLKKQTEPGKNDSSTITSIEIGSNNNTYETGLALGIGEQVFSISLDNILSFIEDKIGKEAEAIYLKIDTDGSELDILSGASRLLSSTKLEGILIEFQTNDQLKLIQSTLETFGFILKWRATTNTGNAIFKKVKTQ